MIAALLICVAVIAFVDAAKPAWRGPKDCAALCAHGGEQQQSHQRPCVFYTPRSSCNSQCDMCRHGKKAAVNCATECYKLAQSDMHKVSVVQAHKDCVENCSSTFHCECSDNDEVEEAQQ